MHVRVLYFAVVRERLGRSEEAIELPMFIESIFYSPPQRVEGTAVFLSAEKGATPFALLPGPNVFRITAGSVTKEISITGQ